MASTDGLPTRRVWYGWPAHTPPQALSQTACDPAASHATPRRSGCATVSCLLDINHLSMVCGAAHEHTCRVSSSVQDAYGCQQSYFDGGEEGGGVQYIAIKIKQVPRIISCHAAVLRPFDGMLVASRVGAGGPAAWTTCAEHGATLQPRACAQASRQPRAPRRPSRPGSASACRRLRAPREARPPSQSRAGSAPRITQVPPAIRRRRLARLEAPPRRRAP